MKSILISTTLTARHQTRARLLLLAALIGLAQAQVVGPDHTSFTGNETLGSGRIDTTGIVVFSDNSSAGTGSIFARGSTRVFFRDNSTAGSAQFNFTTLNHADRNILRFEGRSSAGSALISSTGLGLSDVEFTDQSDGPQVRINFAHGLDISGASTGTGTTGRTRATTLVRTPTSVVADDSRIVSVESANVRVVGLGSNTLRIGGGSINTITDVGVFQSADGLTMTGGGIIKVGANNLVLGWDFASTPYAVPLEIQGGRVDSYRQVLGRVVIGAAGTLNLQSVVEGDLSNAGRLITWIGDFRRIAGNFSQSATGTTTLNNVFFFSGFSPSPSLNIAGTAILAGRLEIIGPSNTNNLAGLLPVSHEFLRSGGISGRYETVTVQAPARFQALPRYTPTRVFIDYSLRSYESFGLTPGGLAMGRHLDVFGNNLTPLAFPLRSFIAQINTISADALTAAIESLVPDVYGAALDGAIQSGQSLRKAVAQSLVASDGRSKGFTTMFAGNSRRSRFDAIQGLPEARESSAGGMVGMIGTFGDVSAGLFIAQEDADTELDHKGSLVEREMQSAALSVRYRTKGFHAQVIAAAGRGEAELHRLVGTPGQGPLARGTTDTELRLYAGELGYQLDQGRWQMGVSVGYTNTTVKWDDFTETNGSGIELTLAGLDFDSRQLRAGVQAGVRLAQDKMRLRASIAAVRELEDDRTFLARLAGAPVSASFYRAPGRAADRNAMQAGLELEWYLRPNLVFSASYAGARGDHTRVTSDFSAGFRWSF